MIRRGGTVTGHGSKPRPRKVKNLEEIAMEEYLMLLQGACAGYINLLKLNSILLEAVRDNILETLKTQLRQNLFGTMSTVLRQQMIDTVLSGKFPTKTYYCVYEPSPEGPISGKIEDFVTDSDRATLESIRKYGKKCNSVCCTGAFIIEAMLSVLVNEDVRILKFERPASQIFWNRDRFLRKYVPLQIPAVLAHYEKAVRDSVNLKSPKLEKFVIRDTNIISRSFAIRNNHFDVLTTYQDTSAYLEIPGYLSAVADPANGLQYGGFSEHLMLMIGEVFQCADRFERMTEIFLDSEACNTLLRMSNHRERCISHDLFHGIGISCPNLRILDLSNGIAISAECLIQLIFRNGYSILHQFVYLPQYKIDDYDRIVQVQHCPVDEIHQHDTSRYCPWCPDEWCSNAVRDGLGWSDTRTPIVDDRLYNEIEEKHGKKYLVNVVKASDLITAMNSKILWLRRPPGPSPWEKGFVPPGETPFVDLGEPWYMPKEIIYTESDSPPVVNKLAKSLQCLKLNSDNFHPKHEIVPFLLAALPNVKTLGRVKVVKGLKMIRDIPAFHGITANHLEELDMTFGGHDICCIDTSWASDDIVEMVEDFGEKMSLTHTSTNHDEIVQELRSSFAEDIKLVAEQCPRLRSLKLSIFGDTVFLGFNDIQIFEPIGSQLLNLKELIIQSHTWAEVAALLKLVGPRLARLHLMLEGRGVSNESQDQNNDAQVPKLEAILERCPNVENMTLSFGMRSVDVSTSEIESSTSSSSPLCSLKNFAVHTYMTKRALQYLWARAVNLVSLKIPYTLVTADVFPHEVVEFNEADVVRLFRSNKMPSLKSCLTSFTFRNIETSKVFIENLPAAEEISKLSIVVGLPEDHYPTEEQMFIALAQVMQAMRKFKLYCGEKLKFGQKIRWRWSRTGPLESLVNLGPLQGLVDMSDEEV